MLKDSHPSLIGRHALSVAVCIGGFALSGCGAVSFLGASGHPPESCIISSLAEPMLVSPESFAVVDAASVELRWSYPEEYCNPQNFEIYVSENVGFGFFEGEPTFETFTVDGATRQVTPTGLEPGLEYRWRVRAYSAVLYDARAEAEAEFSPEGEYGPYSETWNFFTGPVCHVASLIAPEQVSPEDGVTVTTTQPSFEWSYPDACVPDFYIIHLSTDPSFSDPSLNGVTSRPSTRWGVGRDLEPCTWYFWRVFASVDDVPGPFSPTWSFFVPPMSTPGADCDPSAPPPLPPLSPITGGAAALCGNGVLDSGEECEEDSQCGEDLFCGDPGTRAPCQCVPTCGDGLCASYESAAMCPQDCGSDSSSEPAGPSSSAGEDGSLCGDGVCQAGESPEWCGDCVPDIGDGLHPPSGEPECGNGVLEKGESCETAADCGKDFACTSACACIPVVQIVPFCGDGTCNGSETCASCFQDCGLCIVVPAYVCGDGKCSEGEICEADCAPY